MKKAIRRMTGIEVIEKQEEYRQKTIELVGNLRDEGKENNEIAEEVGISVSEVSVILSIIDMEKKGKKSNKYRVFF